jgi:hypothetical protein
MVSPPIRSTDFSPAARQRTTYWQRGPETGEGAAGALADMAFLTWADSDESRRMVSVRVPGKRSLQEVSEEDRKAEIEKA